MCRISADVLDASLDGFKIQQFPAAMAPIKGANVSKKG